MRKKLSKAIVEYFPWILLILGLVVYGAALLNGFVWDDEEQVVNNPSIRSLANIPYLFTQSTFNTGGGAGMAGLYYKPIMPLFFTLIYRFFGLNAWGYHLVQIVIHIINSYLIYLIFQHFSQKKLLAAILSLIFLVHPANTETVLYISGLQDVLFMFFGLLAFYFVLLRPKLSDRNWFIVCLLLLLSILSKETGVLFWLLMAVYLFFYRKPALKLCLIFLSLLFGLYLILRFGLAGVGLNENKLSPIMLADYSTRLQTIPKIIAYYLRLVFFPLTLAISQHWLVQQMTLTDFYLPLFMDIVFFAGLLIFCLKKNDCGFWFFSILLMIGLGIHSQLIPLDMTVSERWVYFPLWAILGIILNLIAKTNIKEDNILVFGLLLIILFSARSALRVFDWRDGLTLYLKDEPLAKNNFDFENNLGVYLHRAGRYQEAFPHYLRSTEIAPQWWTNWNNLGVSYERNKQPKKAEEAYLKAIANGDYYLAYENYANLLLKQKRFSELDKFLKQRALVKFPYNERLNQIYQYLRQQNAD